MSAVDELLAKWRTAVRASSLLGQLVHPRHGQQHCATFGRHEIPVAALVPCCEMLADALQADALILESSGLLDVMGREALLSLRNAVNRRLDAPRGLSEAQRDGRACTRCGRDDRAMVPLHVLDGVQTFVCVACDPVGH